MRITEVKLNKVRNSSKLLANDTIGFGFVSINHGKVVDELELQAFGEDNRHKYYVTFDQEEIKQIVAYYKRAYREYNKKEFEFWEQPKAPDPATQPQTPPKDFKGDVAKAASPQSIQESKKPWIGDDEEEQGEGLPHPRMPGGE